MAVAAAVDWPGFHSSDNLLSLKATVVAGLFCCKPTITSRGGARTTLRTTRRLWLPRNKSSVIIQAWKSGANDAKSSPSRVRKRCDYSHRETHRAALLIDRNQRLLQQATKAQGRTEAMRALPTTRRHSDWATLAWRSPGDRRDLP
jgi:hypothetical protein